MKHFFVAIATVCSFLIAHSQHTFAPAAFDLLTASNLDGRYAPGLADGPNAAPNQANILPIANAGPDKTITLPTSSDTLDASASGDPDGSIVQYYWSQAQGPVQSVISNAFSKTPIVTGLNTAGKYVFVLQVKNNLGNLAYAQKTVTVLSAVPDNLPACVYNLLPANGAQVVPPASTTLSWTASPGATSYDVYFGAGTEIPSRPVFSTTALSYSPGGITQGGNYTWYIVPRNNNGANTSCATTNVSRFSVPVPADQPGIPNAGGDVSITLPTNSVTLDASASTGSIVQYYWYQISGPNGAVITNNFSAVTTASVLVQTGKYVFGLQVKDKNGIVKYASKTVTVLPATTPGIPGCASNPSPANGSTVFTSTTATLSWSPVTNASSYDVYLWKGDSTPVSPIITTPNSTYSANNLAWNTTYKWYVVPKNQSGTAIGCDANNIWTFTTFLPVPPCVTNISPAAGSVLTTATTATLTWPASPGAANYYVYLTAGIGAPSNPVTNTNALSYTVTGLNPGTTYSWAIAPWAGFIGSNYSCASSNYTTFTTASAGSQPLVANAGDNTMFSLPYSLAYLDGSASTGNIVQFYWYQINGPVQVSIASNFSATAKVTGFSAAGTYVFGLQVKDNKGVLKYASKTITVTPANAARMADASSVTNNTTTTKETNDPLPSISAFIGPNRIRAGQQATLQINSNKACAVMINTVTSTGVIIGVKKINLVAGINTSTLSTAGLAQGLHVINICGAGKPINLKLVIE